MGRCAFGAHWQGDGGSAMDQSGVPHAPVRFTRDIVSCVIERTDALVTQLSRFGGRSDRRCWVTPDCSIAEAAIRPANRAARLRADADVAAIAIRPARRGEPLPAAVAAPAPSRAAAMQGLHSSIVITVPFFEYFHSLC